MTVYDPTSAATPYPARIADLERELADLHRGGRPYGSEPSRVWTCAVDRRRGGLNALLVWGFLNGMDDGETTPGVVPYPPTDERQPGKGGLVGEPTWSEAAPMPFGDRAFWPVECVACFLGGSPARNRLAADLLPLLSLRRSPHFNPPLSSEDRYEQLFGPILESLGRGKVDMVELGVGRESSSLLSSG